MLKKEIKPTENLKLKNSKSALEYSSYVSVKTDEMEKRLWICDFLVRFATKKLSKNISLLAIIANDILLCCESFCVAV